jgi:hypothetical protein
LRHIRFRFASFEFVRRCQPLLAKLDRRTHSRVCLNLQLSSWRLFGIVSEHTERCGVIETMFGSSSYTLEEAEWVGVL